MALSTQVGYIMPVMSMLQFKKVKLKRELTTFRVGGIHTINPLQ